VAGQLLAVQALLVVLVLAAAGTLTVTVAANRETAATAAEVQRVAQAVAADPWVARQLSAADPTATLQPYTEQLRLATGTDFIVIMAPDRTRYTHTDPTQIGQQYLGTIDQALAGATFVETYTGTLGPSVRAVTPIRDDAGDIVALVAAGVTTDAIHTQLERQLPYLFGALGVLLLIALAGSVLVSRRLRRQTGGMDAESLRRMYSSHDAVLHSIREGLVVVDDKRRVSLVNDEATKLLGLPADAAGRPVVELDLPQSLADLFRYALVARDEMHLAGDRILVVNQSPATFHGRSYGTVATLRDRTEMEALTGELDIVRAFAESLRSQAHEASNKLHTMVGLVETGRYDTAVEYATAELELSQRLTDRVVSAVDEPILAALLLGKTSQAAERGVELLVSEDSSVPPGLVPSGELITILGNLIDNAIDACSEQPVGRPRRIDVYLAPVDGDFVIEVADSGPGLPADLTESAFTRGWSTKPVTTPGGRGLGLALVQQAVRRRGGTITVGRSPYGGAEFSITLPPPAVAPAGGSTPESTPAPEPDEPDQVDDAQVSAR